MGKTSYKRVLRGVVVGIVALVGVILLLAHSLGNTTEPLFAGKPMAYWQRQLNGLDVGASNEAFAIVSSQIVPRLADTLLYDTNDSSLRLFLVETLNGIPGVQIIFAEAGTRQCDAAKNIGRFGPAAESAVPAMVEALKRENTLLREAVILSLGKIHSDPQVVIPLLIGYLGDSRLDDEAALALGDYGSLAKVAVPKLVLLLHAKDYDARAAAMKALKKIAPEALAGATNAVHGGITNSASVKAAGYDPHMSR